MGNFREITKRLEKLKEYIKILKGLQKCRLEDFKRDPVLKGALERYLQLSAETSIDIGEIIISEKNFTAPMFNREIFEIMAKNKIISPKLSSTFQEIAKFRNLLVHDYTNINIDKLYNYLKNDLKDFDKYIRAAAIFLKKEY